MTEPNNAGPDLSSAVTMIAVSFAAFAFVIVMSVAFGDGDTGWHIATGAWIVEHGTVPRTDPFSFTARGHPWVAHEWLSEVAMYAAWCWAGWKGVILLFGTAMAALYAIVTAHLLRWQRPGAVVLTMIYLSIGLAQSVFARPHLIALPILAAWLIALIRARERDRAPPLALALLMLVWANAHGSFIFGLALAGAFGLEALVTAPAASRWKVVRDWGLFGILCLIAALLTPGGIGGLLYPIYVNNLTLLTYIAEWQPARFGGATALEILLLSGLFFLFFRPVRIPVVRLLILLVALHITFDHIRNQMVLVTLAVILLAEPLGRAWSDGIDRPRPAILPQLRTHWRELSPLLAVAALLFVGAATYRLATPFDREDSYGVPVTAMRHIPPALRGQPVFNEYSFGGLLVFEGIAPFIDGRSDMYGDDFTANYVKIEHGDVPTWRKAEERWRFGWTILPPNNPLVAVLDKEPGWRRLYADKWAVIHVSDRAAAPQKRP
ncbi:hypothetical protein FPZ24_15255 [Sphingomonas panacisoli]|uniref:Glycosyltransferase RgtA/B/C/D-like domain-containing protein n=1 Tax=Sphingomonas panacisoli TaxID=1813879 RepID=A0A5B8LLS8_9SPHN|nr:hypothetical protein [Sphingomonas panacisoli]QDZ08655.1 hypothetical protein FPZ24_15255 [Sphingomonas panacisoli]